MKTNRFLEKYLILLTDRLTTVATVISLSFWIVLSIFEAVTFSGTFFDIINRAVRPLALAMGI